MKKIIIAVTKSNWGGAQKYVFDVALYSKQKGYQVTVLSQEGGELNDNLKKESIAVRESKFFTRDVSFLRDFKSFLEMYNLFKIEKPAVVHLNSSKIGVLGSVAARMTGVGQIIFTVHGLALNEQRSCISKLYIWLAYYITFILCNSIISVSDSLTAQIQKKFIGVGSKISTIKNGFKEFKLLAREDARKELCARMGIADESAVGIIGTIGELHPIKGHLYMIRAFKKILESISSADKDYHLLIIGEGEYRSMTESEIAKLNLQSNVHLLGHVKNARELLSGFDFFCMPSLSEGLGYAPAEAAYAELPIVASRVGGIPEIVDDTHAVLVPAQDVDAIYKGLYTLITDPNVRKKLTYGAREELLRRFGFETQMGKTLSMYEL